MRSTSVKLNAYKQIDKVYEPKKTSIGLGFRQILPKSSNEAGLGERGFSNQRIVNTQQNSIFYITKQIYLLPPKPSNFLRKLNPLP